MDKLKWVVEFTVDPSWVEDGFNLTEDSAIAMLENALPWAYSHELGAQIIEAPDKKVIRQIQGYEEV